MRIRHTYIPLGVLLAIMAMIAVVACGSSETATEQAEPQVVEVTKIVTEQVEVPVTQVVTEQVEVTKVVTEDGH